MNIYLREEWKKFNILMIKEVVVDYKRKFSKSHKLVKHFCARQAAAQVLGTMMVEDSESNGIKDSFHGRNKKNKRERFKLIINFVRDAWMCPS